MGGVALGGGVIGGGVIGGGVTGGGVIGGGVIGAGGGLPIGGGAASGGGLEMGGGIAAAGGAAATRGDDADTCVIGAVAAVPGGCLVLAAWLGLQTDVPTAFSMVGRGRGAADKACGDGLDMFIELSSRRFAATLYAAYWLPQAPSVKAVAVSARITCCASWKRARASFSARNDGDASMRATSRISEEYIGCCGSIQLPAAALAVI